MRRQTLNGLVTFETLGCRFNIRSADRDLLHLVERNWSQLTHRLSHDLSSPADGPLATRDPAGPSGSRSETGIPNESNVVIEVHTQGPGEIVIAGDSFEPSTCSAPCDFLNELEREVILHLQRSRPDLLFVHAAVVSYGDKAWLLSARSGGGKSTTIWALMQQGFGYLSDELAPIDIDHVQVWPYPRAIALKQSPPAPYELPARRLELEHTILLPVDEWCDQAVTQATAIGGILFLDFEPSRRQPEIRSVSPAEASARLYADALNQLAHPNRGLQAVTKLAQRLNCYLLQTADLAATCELIRSTIESQLADESNTGAE